MNIQIELSKETVATFCQRHHIRKLAVFGSVLHGDFRADSDIDILVEFDPEAQITLFDMGAAQVELSQLLNREVDLKTAGFLSPYFREDVIQQAKTIYEHQ